jgi:uncharacterized membrane protein (DUF485 family)
VAAGPTRAAPETTRTPEAGASGGQAKPMAWSPLRARGARLSWGLLAIFTLIYFVTAVLTSAEFADLAALPVLGMPLGFLLGLVLMVVGLVVTRIYLSRGTD